MAAVPSWRTGDWDRCKLGGKVFPGNVKVSVGVSCDLDVKKPDGGKGATVRDKGDNPRKVRIDWEVGEEDLPEAAEFAKTVLQTRGTKGARDPLAIEHPQCTFWGVTAVTVEDIDSPPPKPPANWLIRVSLLEWFPAPKPAAKTKKAPVDSPEDVAAWREFADDAATGPNAPNQSIDPDDALGINQSVAP